MAYLHLPGVGRWAELSTAVHFIFTDNERIGNFKSNIGNDLQFIDSDMENILNRCLFHAF